MERLAASKEAWRGVFFAREESWLSKSLLRDDEACKYLECVCVRLDSAALQSEEKNRHALQVAGMS